MMSDGVRSAAAAQAEKRVESWGSLEWLASKQIGNAKGLTLGRVIIKPGQCNPRHRHNACEEILYLLAGTLEHSVGEKTIVLRAGDTLTAPAGVFHNAVNIGDVDADMIVAYDSGARDFELET
ncbi:MAG TPA: cupin domain-containing protein [Candidatus Hydrogenedentes bacterium]|nr:cupin domain-containing protein [Candidatus Hydrogenedentota bacterium]